MRKTVTYVLVSLVLILGGTVLILIPGDGFARAIGTSIVAGGLASLAFGLIGYFDDLDILARHQQLSEDLRSIEQSIHSLRLSKARRSRIHDRRPRKAIAGAVEAAPKRHTIEIDSMGISLKPFYQDMMDQLRTRGRVRARLLLMDYRTAVFQTFCEEQGRDKRRLMQEIFFTTSNVLEAPNQPSSTKQSLGAANHHPCQIELRWDPGFQSVTLTRVDNIVLVRSRLVNEAANSDWFFEAYQNNDPEFETYRRYFDQVWRRSRQPTTEEIEQLRALI